MARRVLHRRSAAFGRSRSRPCHYPVRAEDPHPLYPGAAEGFTLFPTIRERRPIIHAQTSPAFPDCLSPTPGDKS